MTTITMQPVTQSNWRQALRLAVRPEQQRFVSEVTPVAAIALAKAYIRPGGFVWDPFAFYVEDAMVGFVALVYTPDNHDDYWIYHFFIDQRYQGRGYGAGAMRALVEYAQEQHPQCMSIRLTVHPENITAQRLYTQAGFQPTGELRDGEPVYARGIVV